MFVLYECVYTVVGSVRFSVVGKQQGVEEYKVHSYVLVVMEATSTLLTISG